MNDGELLCEPVATVSRGKQRRKERRRRLATEYIRFPPPAYVLPTAYSLPKKTKSRTKKTHPSRAGMKKQYQDLLKAVSPPAEKRPGRPVNKGKVARETVVPVRRSARIAVKGKEKVKAK